MVVECSEQAPPGPINLASSGPSVLKPKYQSPRPAGLPGPPLWSDGPHCGPRGSPPTVTAPRKKNETVFEDIKKRLPCGRAPAIISWHPARWRFRAPPLEGAEPGEAFEQAAPFTRLGRQSRLQGRRLAPCYKGSPCSVYSPESAPGNDDGGGRRHQSETTPDSDSHLISTQFMHTVGAH